MCSMSQRLNFLKHFNNVFNLFWFYFQCNLCFNISLLLCGLLLQFLEDIIGLALQQKQIFFTQHHFTSSLLKQASPTIQLKCQFDQLLHVSWQR